MPFSFSINRSSSNLVPPFEKTRVGTLDLSGVDKLDAMRINVRKLHEELSKALVSYYPLAGGFKKSNDGAWSVEASASSTLPDVNYFVPEIQVAGPIVQVQVTQFVCEGFAIGFIMPHSIVDVLGATQFLNAVGELARGLDHLRISPVWCRGFCSLLPKQPNAFTSPVMPKLEQVMIDFPWIQSISSTISPKQNKEVRAVFYANCHKLINPPAFSRSKSKIASRICQLFEGERSISDEEDPYTPLLTNNTLFVLEWGSQNNINEVYYRWGPPMNVIPGTAPITLSSCVLIRNSLFPKKGVRLGSRDRLLQTICFPLS
ncbi:hypothetical protein K2173_014528 [Erythroxylum novogranatense]|uniref:Uncharacterized protein n=1 Tax=Erythroxylum novogranatense TaxID=1862640 RepID=A0AAV8S552_9ROSI|nr:hypothetical protein K2173_014528 [Erythroxylum novogranatense]